MRVAVSPYHLTTRELPFMAGVLLADSVVTLLPVPPAGVGETEVRKAVVSSPPYFRLLDSWRWTAPLWNEGVVSSLVGREDAVADAAACNATFTREDRWAPMRPFLHGDLFSDREHYLDRLSTDLLKGGPDPGVSVPIVAGLDALAARHGLIVMRLAPTADPVRSTDRGSVAQRAEMLFGEQVFSAAVPVLVQADADIILRARQLLAPALGGLRRAIDGAIAKPGAEAGRAVREAARAYGAAFRERRDQLLATDAGELRVVDGFVTLACRRLPLDAAIMSSVAAVRHVTGRGVNGTSSRPGPTSAITAIAVGTMSMAPT